MKLNKPKFSIETLKRATKVGNAAKKMDLEIGPVRDNAEEFGDMVFFMLSNGPDVCILRCTRYAYFIEYYWNAHRGGQDADYFMVKNVRNFLFYMKRNKFVDFDIWDTRIEESLNQGDTTVEEMVDDDCFWTEDNE